MNDEPNVTDDEQREEAYEPPAVVESARFETIASACGYNPDVSETFPCLSQPSGQ